MLSIALTSNTSRITKQDINKGKIYSIEAFLGLGDVWAPSFSMFPEDSDAVELCGPCDYPLKNRMGGVSWWGRHAERKPSVLRLMTLTVSQ